MSNSRRTNSASANQPSSVRSAPNQIKSANGRLATKEEEYLRINAQLEAKTAELVYEADQAIRENEKMLSDATIMSRINTDDYLNNLISDLHIVPPEAKSKSFTLKPSYEAPNTYRAAQTETPTAINEDAYDLDANIMPKQLHEANNDAQIRFLKAKLRVLQEEIDRLNTESTHKDDENAKLIQRCKEIDEEKQRLQRQLTSNQSQIEKFKKQAEEQSQKFTSSDVQLQNLKKDYDALKKEQKKQQQEQAQIELRLNRSLEEIDKLKQQLNKTQANSKDTNEQERRRVDQLTSDNKRLEKQKSELIQAFKKQMKLIDILKRQKMHLEAAKMLQFTEDEFIKVLEWNPSSQTNTATEK
jgi:chromosome segregation ATPase